MQLASQATCVRFVRFTHDLDTELAAVVLQALGFTPEAAREVATRPLPPLPEAALAPPPVR